MTPYNVLFLCTGNAVRSILAEAILNRKGAPRFRGYSAGSHPKGEVSPRAIALLQARGIATAGLASKSWTAFAGCGAPRLDFVFTVCDAAADETCPVWPGRPVTAHWGVPDPASAGPAEDAIARALQDAYALLDARIAAFCALPLDELDRLARRRRVEAIGRRG